MNAKSIATLLARTQTWTGEFTAGQAGTEHSNAEEMVRLGYWAHTTSFVYGKYQRTFWRYRMTDNGRSRLVTPR